MTLNEIVAKYNSQPITIPMMEQKDINILMASSKNFKLQPYTNNTTKPIYKKLVEELSPERSKTNRDKNKNPKPLYDLQAQMVVYGTAVALKNNFYGMKWSCNKQAYNTLNSVQNRKEGVNYIHMSDTTEFIERMINAGYLHKFTGGVDFSKEDTSYKTVLLFTEKYLKLWDGIYLKSVTEDHNWFELRTRKHKVEGKTQKSGGEVVAVNDELNFEGKNIYKRAITGLNRLCVEQIITMNGQVWKPQYQVIGNIEEGTPLEDWEADLGMRIYGGDFQTQPSGKKPADKAAGLGRHTIEIGGIGVVECDLVGVHMAVAYTQASKKMPDDPYAIDVTNSIEFNNSEQTPKQIRTLLKMFTLMAMNAKGRREAVSAIKNHFYKNRSNRKDGSINENALYTEITSVDWEATLDSIISFHSPIAEAFCNDMGIRYQAFDGRIAARVVDHFVKKGVLCLPWHDSFIVQYHYEDELKQVMQKAWKAVFRNVKNCKITTDIKNVTNNVPSEDRHPEVERFYFEQIPLSAYVNDRFFTEATYERFDDLPYEPLTEAEQLIPEFETIPDTAYCEDLNRVHEEELENLLLDENLQPFERNGKLKPQFSKWNPELVRTVNKEMLDSCYCCSSCNTYSRDDVCFNPDCTSLPF
ncbi:hypothetical protein [Winogradskyella sediminis]|uniref:hypothetical protein n=1 Tax=Winogradskyella sediminis TaxID=1382466 RepID=UPI003AA9A4DA